MWQIWDFLDQISVHFGSLSQNVLKSIWSEKVPDLSHLGANLTHFVANLTWLWTTCFPSTVASLSSVPAKPGVSYPSLNSQLAKSQSVNSSATRPGLQYAPSIVEYLCRGRLVDLINSIILFIYKKLINYILFNHELKGRLLSLSLKSVK